jgi:predicted ATPase
MEKGRKLEEALKERWKVVWGIAAVRLPAQQTSRASRMMSP